MREDSKKGRCPRRYKKERKKERKKEKRKKERKKKERKKDLQNFKMSYLHFVNLAA